MSNQAKNTKSQILLIQELEEAKREIERLKSKVSSCNSEIERLHGMPPGWLK